MIDDDSDMDMEEVPIPKGARKSFLTRKKKDVDLGDALFPLGDHGAMPLLQDHAQRPLWVTDDGHIYLEMFHQAKVYDFIITIAEPIYRPLLMHEYQLTPYSLYGAVSVGLDTETILTDLNRLCKTRVPDRVERMIIDCTQSYGKAKLVLHQNRYFIESATDDVLQTLLRDPQIGASRISSNVAGFATYAAPAPIDFSQQPDDAQADAAPSAGGDLEFAAPLAENVTGEIAEEEEELEKVDAVEQSLRSFEINPNDVGVVKKRCSELEAGPTWRQFSRSWARGTRAHHSGVASMSPRS